MNLQPHQQRVVDEKRELDEKRDRLTAFFGTVTYADLGAEEINRLRRQDHAMTEYSRVLEERIAAFTPIGKLGLPQWKCHKVVGAAKIEAIDTDDQSLVLHFAGGLTAPVSPEWDEKHDAQVGGYFVEYEDGYTSFSPAEAFEKGYTRL